MWARGGAERRVVGTKRCQGSELPGEHACTLKDSRSPRTPRPGTINITQTSPDVASHVGIMHVPYLAVEVWQFSFSSLTII
jgi:hypothetical protein